METKYDIFISYRRDGGEEHARSIQQALIARGYNVFLDFDELRDGKFNEALKAAIAETPIFLILLTRKCLDRCVNEGDWVRTEIETAIQTNRHIIPVNFNSEFDGKFPEDLPIEITKVIGQHQFSDVMSKSLFNVSIDKMVNDRIRPIIKPEEKVSESKVPKNKMATIHLETDLACAVLRFKSLECVVQPDEDKVLHLAKGRHKFTFQSIDNELDCYDCIYEVQDNVEEDFIDINLLQHKRDRLREEALDRKKRKAKGEWYMGEFYEWSYDEENDKEGVENLEAKKDALSAEEAFELGVHYQLGWGTEKDYSKAFECFMRSADKGYTRAEAAVGLAYLTGDGIDKNYKKGVEFIKKAADKAFPYAYYYLGRCYAIQKDYKTAFANYCKAHSQGILTATYSMAECYLFGEGVQINEKKAFELYEAILSQKMLRDAMIRKGECFFYGWGTEVDYAKAFECFQLASKEESALGDGIEWALCRLGNCYEFGYGTEKNYLKAIEMYIKSWDRHYQEAIERIEKELTPSRITKLIADVKIIISQHKELLGNNEQLSNEAKNEIEKDLMILYKFLADKTDDTDSLIELAEFYEQGSGCEKDFKKANELLQILVEKGNIRAYRKLGINIICDNETKDKSSGVEYLQKAVEAGDNEAMLLLGRAYGCEDYDIFSLEESMRYLQMSANEGNSEAQWRLGDLYEAQEEQEQAFAWFTKSAIQQNLVGRYHYARCLFDGVGCSEDITLGLNLLKQCASEGSLPSQRCLAAMYELGEIVEKDMVEAAKWYELAAEQGDTNAMCQYAYMYMFGDGGVKGNDKKALQYFQQAAEGGNAHAEYCLGLIYENGYCGVEVNLEEACLHYHKAAEYGNDKGVLSCGRFLENGLGGCEVDLMTAFQLYLQSAEMGNVEAQTAVGRCYLHGIGERKNEKKAEKYLKLAADSGNTMGIVLLGDLYKATKRYEEAVECYNKVVESGNPLGACQLGRLYARCQELGIDYDKSISYFKQAIEMSDDDDFKAQCFYEMAYTKYYSGDLEGALETIEKALKLDPNENIYDSKGEFLARLGRREEAMEMYNKVLELNPNFFKEIDSDLYKLLFPETK